mmetsp:Transcript_93929/g.251406  ORF Transcript_93929/g.251406 Transcript_93929/m.251406 type:complete len:167 (-) Transcript_93929:212-712(-)
MTTMTTRVPEKMALALLSLFTAVVFAIDAPAVGFDVAALPDFALELAVGVLVLGAFAANELGRRWKHAAVVPQVLDAAIDLDGDDDWDLPDSALRPLSMADRRKEKRKKKKAKNTKRRYAKWMSFDDRVLLCARHMFEGFPEEDARDACDDEHSGSESTTASIVSA